MRTNVVILSIIFICSISILAFLYLSNVKNIYYSEISQLQDNDYILKKRIRAMSSIARDSINLLYITNYNDSSNIISNIQYKQNEVLVLFIPKNFCKECIENEYTRLKKLPDAIQENIVVLTNFTTTRDLKVFLSSIIIDYPVYNYDSQIFNELINLKDPIIFVLDYSFIPQFIFIPISFMPKLTDEYFDFIIQNIYKIKQIKDIMPIHVLAKYLQYSFGKIKMNQQVETNFEFENLSDSPFVISNVESNCGCTVVEWNRNPILKGDKAIIRVEYQATEKGFFSKRISVFSNSSDSPHVFTISGVVE